MLMRNALHLTISLERLISMAKIHRGAHGVDEERFASLEIRRDFRHAFSSHLTHFNSAIHLTIIIMRKTYNVDGCFCELSDNNNDNDDNDDMKMAGLCVDRIGNEICVRATNVYL